MNVMLDTNVLREDFLMNSSNSKILFDYLKKTNSKNVLTEIVYREIKAVYERELRDRYKEYIKAMEYFSRALVDKEIMVENKKFNIEKSVEEYITYLKKTLRVVDEQIIPIKDSYLTDIVSRAVERRRPCSIKGEEFRDVILWLTALDVAYDDEQKQLILISNNTKQFASDDGYLHPCLADEAKTKGVTIIYYNSIKHFIKDHTVKIDYINDEWLKGVINFELINEQFVNILDNHQDVIDRWVELQDFTTTGYINPLTSFLDISEFFIYEMTDESLYVEVILTGEVEVEVEIEVEDDIKEKEWEYKYKLDPLTGDLEPEIVLKNILTDKESSKCRCFYPEFNVTLGISIKDKEVKSFEIKEWDFL